MLISVHAYPTDNKYVITDGTVLSLAGAAVKKK